MGAVIGTAGATKAPPSQRDCPLYRVRLLWRPASAVNPGRVIGLSSTPKPPAYSRASRPRSSDCGQNPQAAHRRLQVKKHGGCRLGATMPPPLTHAAFWHGQSVGRQKRCGNCCSMTPLAWTKARIPPNWISVLYREVSALNPGIVMVSLRVISLNAVRLQLRTRYEKLATPVRQFPSEIWTTRSNIFVAPKGKPSFIPLRYISASLRCQQRGIGLTSV